MRHEEGQKGNHQGSEEVRPLSWYIGFLLKPLCVSMTLGRWPGKEIMSMRTISVPVRPFNAYLKTVFSRNCVKAVDD